METSVKPLGSVSVAVTVPLVATAPGAFDTVTVYAAPACPCTKLPLCTELTPSPRVAGTSQLPIACHPLLALDPAAYISMPFAPAYAAVNVTGRVRTMLFPDGTAVAAAALIEHALLLSVSPPVPSVDEDQTVAASLSRNNWVGALA
jgi:hypothetical protein